jgi:putative hemolysin
MEGEAVGGYARQVALVLALVLLNAAFSGSETALVSLREGQLRKVARASRGGRALARLVRDPNRFLATTQLGITLAGFLAAAAAAVSLAEPLVGPLAFLGSFAKPVAVVLVTTALTFVTLVLGELAPKRIAMQRAQRWGLLVARPLDLLAALSRPAVWLLSQATNLVVRLFGGDPQVRREEVSAEELREMVLTQRGFSPQQQAIVSGAFEIGERTLRQILVPRNEVTCLPARMPTEQAMRRMAETGRSRAPVTGERGLDEVIGVVHIRDLVGGDGLVGEHAREALFLPETLRVADALRQMRQCRQRLALVVDERGVSDGIVTMEDLLEEVVGELYDETDPDVQTAVREQDGALLVPGSFPLQDLPEIGITVEFRPPGDYTTVAGLVLVGLGHLPTEPGEIVHLPTLTAQVVEVSGHAIRKVRLRPNGGAADSAEGVGT